MGVDGLERSVLRRLLPIGLACSLALSACGPGTSGAPVAGTSTPNPTQRASTPSANPTTSPSSLGSFQGTLVGAGDIAACGTKGHEQTAALLDTIEGTVITLGDNAYASGTASEFQNCYAPTWGRHKLRTRPAAGNHEYLTQGATGYFEYFGAAAGDRTRGYYSYNVGTWHVIVLNSNCGSIGGCRFGSSQEIWLRSDLASSRSACTLAYWHHPRFNSGFDGDNPQLSDLFFDLYQSGADLLLAGHSHDYERFLPMDPQGRRDDQNGITQIVVGTGGIGFTPFGSPRPNSVVRDNTTFGVIRLDLYERGYEWRFVPVASGKFSDAGSGLCH